MSKMRVLTSLVLLATGGLLMPASAASAATALTANIVCDGETGTVTTWTSGPLTGGGTPTSVTVEFQRKSGVRVSTGGYATLPPLAQPVTVQTTTNSYGEVSAVGYGATFDPATTKFYRETVAVTFKLAGSDTIYASREATCDYDSRTTVTLTCDPAAGTVTAVVTGRDGQAGNASGYGRPATISYHTAATSQANADDPAFTGETLGWDFTHRITQAADGTWTDNGYVHTIRSSPYYYAEKLTVAVFDAYGSTVGSGTAACVYADQRPGSAA